jgi:outer membrane protein TolC
LLTCRNRAQPPDAFALRQRRGQPLDWLDAQRSLFSAKQALIQTRLAYQQNQVLFFKAVGGATTAPMTKM